MKYQYLKPVGFFCLFVCGFFGFFLFFFFGNIGVGAGTISSTGSWKKVPPWENVTRGLALTHRKVTIGRSLSFISEALAFTLTGPDAIVGIW
jgi:hypothetical protein